MSQRPNFNDGFKKMRDRTTGGAAISDEHPVDGFTRHKPGDKLNLPLTAIQTNPDQPRRHFDPEKLAELAASIRDHGVIQPVLIKATTDPRRFLLVAGERRMRASQEAGLSIIPAILTDGDEEELALIENLQREDLKPLEEAEALARLARSHEYTQEQLAQVVGKSRRSVGESLTLLELPPVIQSEWRTSAIGSKSQLLQVVREIDPEKQRALWQAIREGRLSVQGARKARSGSRVGRPKNASERFTINDQKATVTVSFRKSVASDEEIISALEAAQTSVRRRLNA